MDQDERSTANGTNGYLADGTRVQVPGEYRHSIYLVENARWSPNMHRFDAVLHLTHRRLHRLHYLIPPGVLGPVEGDGSWFDDDLTSGRIVTLWVEQGGAMWNRLHRPRERVRPRRDVGGAW